VTRRPPGSRPPSDPDDVLGLLEAPPGAEPIEDALRAGIAVLARLTGARAAALLLVEGEEISTEVWHPGEPGAADAGLAGELRALAKRRVRADGAAGDGVRDVAVVRLAAFGRAQGIVALPGGTTDRPAARAARVARVARLLEWKLAASQENTRAQVVRAQYERWFRSLTEQVRVLDRERQKFAAIVHATDAFVFVADPSRRIRWTNNLLSSREAPETGSWIGRVCADACAAFAGAACDDCPAQRAMRDKQVVHHEFRRVVEGGVQSLYLSALPIVGPHGRPEETLVMIQDLSGLAMLRRSEARYRLLYERSAKALVLVDPGTGAVLDANPMASRMTGLPIDALRGMPLEKLHPKHEWKRLHPEYARAFHGGTMSVGDCRIRRRDGHQRIATVAATRHELEGNEVVMLEFQDVTDTRRVEQALREAEERLRAVVANAPVVLFAIDRQGVFTTSEGRGLEALGMKPGEVVGRSVFDVYAESPGVLAAIDRALAGEEFTESVTVAGLVFETRYSTLRDADGRPAGVIGVATDVTERRSLEDRLRHAQRMESLGRLAGGVAHDFNNLLASILGHSELMLRRLEGGDPLRAHASQIQEAGGRGAMLTGRLLAFSRKEVLSPRVLDLNQVVGGMLDMLRRLIGEDIELKTVLSDAPATTRADRAQLEQVVMNLVVNARDAMPQGGTLTLEVGEVEIDAAEAAPRSPVAPAGRHVRLTVADNGCGMDQETLSHAFEPFFTTKEPGRGTGLGLSIVYGIVEQSGGFVQVASAPGEGATFRVHLPFVDEAPEQAAEPPPAFDPASGGTETVLVVEDEAAVRSLTCELLRSFGYAVLEAGDGIDALRVAAAHEGELHLLVTDVVMPQMGGGELAQRLTERRPGLKVLYVSGYTDDAVVRHGVREKGRGFLQKPFSLDVFARKVREVLDAPTVEERDSRAA
jgi:PAS domain S-box-containing protein